jgi:hypothetical protein
MREADLSINTIQDLFMKQVMDMTEKSRKERIASNLSIRWL